MLPALRHCRLLFTWDSTGFMRSREQFTPDISGTAQAAHSWLAYSNRSVFALHTCKPPWFLGLFKPSEITGRDAAGLVVPQRPFETTDQSHLCDALVTRLLWFRRHLA